MNKDLKANNNKSTVMYIAQSVSELDFNFERAVGGSIYICSILTAGKKVELKILM